MVTWDAVASGLVNNGGWVINDNGRTLRFNVEDSNDDCGTLNPNVQTGTATGTFTLEEAATLTATVTGLGEPFVTGSEVMTVFLNGVDIAQGQSSEIDDPPTCDAVAIEAVSTPTVVAPGTYTISIDFTTGDERFHTGVFFQTDLQFVPIS